uniref:Uncharacterized protein n=2 Tax=Hemiselmis andersenii TaxID=464988 RepID=A0A7S0XTF8_HEMAN|mmetsp:Transcript_20411/g.47001  ORF Transcript_20411/g.47001 Transcript_20411/m.47001 type:complete len:223 (+) Transcript_20411:36-704(+)
MATTRHRRPSTLLTTNELVKELESAQAASQANASDQLRERTTRNMAWATMGAAGFTALVWFVVMWMDIVDAGHDGDPSRTHDVGDHGTSWENRMYDYYRGVVLFVLQLPAVVLAVLGALGRVSWQLFLHSVVTVLITSLGVVLPIASITDATPSGSRGRLIADSAMVFLSGSASAALSFLTAVRCEVDTVLPAMYREIDAQAVDILNNLIPAVADEYEHGGG